MTIPKETLVLDLPEPEKMRLGDIKLFQPRGFDLVRFTEFLARYSNWTMEQIDDLEAGEMEKAFAAIEDKIKDAAIPKGSSASSKRGRAPRRRAGRNGHSSLSMPATLALTQTESTHP